MKQSPVFVVVEHFRGEIRPVSYEAASFATTLADRWKTSVRAILPGDEPASLAAEFAGRTGIDTTAVTIAESDGFVAETWRPLAGLLAESTPKAVVAADTVRGSECMHYLAAVCGTTAVSGVEAVTFDDGNVSLRRSVFGGKLWEWEHPEGDSLFALVQPGAFAAMEPAGASGAVDVVALAASDNNVVRLRTERTDTGSVRLDQADTIVAVGRGIGKPENLPRFRAMVMRFSNAALGASRPVCDQGVLGYAHQVGQTGATVAPKLYLACGISGASQHLAGMRGAEFVVAINTDPEAAIFQVADVAVVDDATAVVDSLLNVLDGEETR